MTLRILVKTTLNGTDLMSFRAVGVNQWNVIVGGAEFIVTPIENESKVACANVLKLTLRRV